MINQRSRTTIWRFVSYSKIVILIGCWIMFQSNDNNNSGIVDAFGFPVLGRKPKCSLLSSDQCNIATSTTQLFMASTREEEIRRKIRQLKKEGRLGNKSSGTSPSNDAKMNTVDFDVDVVYSDKVRRKLGKSKSQMLGFATGSSEDDRDLVRIQDELDQVAEETTVVEWSSAGTSGTMRGQIGTRTDLQQGQPQHQSTASYLDSLQATPTNTSPSEWQQCVNIDPAIFDRSISTPEPESPEMTQEQLLELVAQKLAEKRQREEKALEAAARVTREKGFNQTLSMQMPSIKDTTNESATSDPTESLEQRTTTGVGGTWTKDDKLTEDMYKPKTGSWGAFPRPKDISKTYGGGRRVGAGFSKEDDANANIKTQRLLKEYRRKVGIEVPTEQEHAAEIDEALKIGQLAMQRGIYATAVSALEKVTQWCSTNSKVGSKVYLDLAMAYEAVGRTKEAYQVYKTLSECRLEDVKHNAKTLLYGMEAMEIMRDVSSDFFSRTTTRNTFIDATGLATIAQNFDDVYNTAYIDLEGGFYKKLTESVVRSDREARQILLKATGKGEVGRTRIVQALRCLSRQFDESLQSELATTDIEEPTAFLNGKPIVKGAPTGGLRDPVTVSLGDFQLLSPDEMTRNLAGKWRLQLLADKSGDGVSFFNTTTAIQEFSTEAMSFVATGPSGFVTIQSSGKIEVENSKRILSRYKIETSGVGAGGLFGLFQGGKNSGFPAAVSRTEQIISVDSMLLITKCAPGSRKGRDAEKEHFAVWRRDSADENLL
jgi:hypothetical protein